MGWNRPAGGAGFLCTVHAQLARSGCRLDNCTQSRRVHPFDGRLAPRQPSLRLAPRPHQRLSQLDRLLSPPCAGPCTQAAESGQPTACPHRRRRREVRPRFPRSPYRHLKMLILALSHPVQHSRSRHSLVRARIDSVEPRGRPLTLCHSPRLEPNSPWLCYALESLIQLAFLALDPLEQRCGMVPRQEGHCRRKGEEGEFGVLWCPASRDILCGWSGCTRLARANSSLRHVQTLNKSALRLVSRHYRLRH